MSATFVHKSQQPRIPTTQAGLKSNRFYSNAVLVSRLGRGAKDPRQQSTKVEKLENTTSELHRTKIIQKVYLSTKLHEFEENWEMTFFFVFQNRTFSC